MGLFSFLTGKVDKDEFARQMMAALRKAGDNRPTRYNAAEYRLEFGAQAESAAIINLHNVFKVFQGVARRDRSEFFRHHARIFLHRVDIPEDFEDVKPDLMPTIRSRALLEDLRLDPATSGSKAAELPAVLLGEYLMVNLVYDLPGTMQFVNGDVFQKWGVSIYEAIEVARQNLETREGRLICADDRFYIAETGDAYDAARLLNIDKLKQLKVVGRHVVMPVTRDCLVITGSEDDAGLEMMASIAESKADDPRPLCPIPMILSGGQWETWLPPTQHFQRKRFEVLAAQFVGGEYHDQQKRLESLNEKNGVDVFVATFSAFEKDGRIVTYCTWSKGVPSWLPKTDMIAFVDPEKDEAGTVGWDEVSNIMGARMTKLDMYPPRWSVDSFPSHDELKASGYEPMPSKR